MRTPKPILDRRRSVRVEEELRFKIGREDYEAEARTVNISEHGVLCLVEKNVPLMTQLAVALTLPASDKKAKRGKILRIKAVVVRREKDPVSEKYLLAIYFSQISAENREILNRFIESRLTRQNL